MRQALDGIRVLDLSRLLPGPYCSMMLGDLGAEVIKVEDTKGGDPTRWNPRVGPQGAAFLQLNRNKKSIALDLKKAEGRNIFLKLAAKADVVLEQFRPGVIDRLGIDYRTVSELNQRIVYCSLTGYGQEGPHRDRAGHDINYIALSGILGLTADEHGKPVIPGVQIADLGGAMVAAFVILAALLARQRTGRGQWIDVSMFDVMLSMLPIPAAYQFAGEDIKVGSKYRLTGAYPFYNVYETSDGKFMSLGALEPKFWESFCHSLGREDLTPRQFDEGKQRQELFLELQRIFKSRSQAEWVELMRDADACCEPVLSITEAFRHAHTRAREMIRQMDHPSEGPIEQFGFPYKLKDTPPRMSLPPPALGEHTNELLAELGIPEAERQRLCKAGVTRSVDANNSPPAPK